MAGSLFISTMFFVFFTCSENILVNDDSSRSVNVLHIVQNGINFSHAMIDENVSNPSDKPSHLNVELGPGSNHGKGLQKVQFGESFMALSSNKRTHDVKMQQEIPLHRERRIFGARSYCFPTIEKICYTFRFYGIAKPICVYRHKRECYALD